jgi:hypothetical protein
VSKFRWLTFGVVGGGFIVLYGVLLAIVWRASKTITQQQAVIEEHATRQVEALNRLLQDRINVLFSEVMSALSEARADAAFENSREYRELVLGCQIS